MRLKRVTLVVAAALACAAILGCSDCNGDGELEDLECILPSPDPAPDEEPYTLSVVVSVADAWIGKRCVRRADAPDQSAQEWSDELSAGTTGVYVHDFLHSERTYVVDVWIDLDDDGRCDPPPADAAWHFDLPNPSRAMDVDVDAATPMTATCP